MDIDQATNARYGRIVLGIYAVINAVTLIGAAIGLWVLSARANHRGIAPNTSLGFRTQHTLASLHGWYVGQRVGFRFAAISTTVIAVAVLVVLAAALLRGRKLWWIVPVPIVGGIAVGVAMVIAGQRAEHAAITVERPAATSAVPGALTRVNTNNGAPQCASACRAGAHRCRQVRPLITSRTASSETPNIAANRVWLSPSSRRARIWRTASANSFALGCASPAMLAPSGGMPAQRRL
jgi:hypothetical protein